MIILIHKTLTKHREVAKCGYLQPTISHTTREICHLQGDGLIGYPRMFVTDINVLSVANSVCRRSWLSAPQMQCKRSNFHSAIVARALLWNLNSSMYITQISRTHHCELFRDGIPAPCLPTFSDNPSISDARVEFD
jgi:hypothetical protein